MRAPGHTVALHTRLGLGDRQLDRGRDLDRDDVALEEGDLGRHALDHVVGGVAERDRRDVHLVVRVVVHEHVVVAVAVQELHLLAVDDRLLDPDAGVEGAVEHVAVLHVAQLGAHEGAALAGLDVLELDDLEQAVVELERDPGLQVVGGDGRHGVSLGNSVRIRQPGVGDLDKVLDAEAAESHTIEARLDGHDVPGPAVRPSETGDSNGSSWISSPTPWPVQCRNHSS